MGSTWIRALFACSGLILSTWLAAPGHARAQVEEGDAPPRPPARHAPGSDDASDVVDGQPDAASDDEIDEPAEIDTGDDEATDDDATDDEATDDDATDDDATYGEVDDEEAPGDDDDEEAPGDDDDEEAPGDEDEEEGEGDELTLAGSITGQYRHRFVMLSDFPLQPLPRTDPAETGHSAQHFYGEQWLRLGGELRLDPILRLYGQADVLYGVAYGDLAVGNSPSGWSREEYGYPGLRLRQLYLDWRTPIGLIRIGQMAFSWGLGIISNGGEDPPVFGDPRFGDLVRRILFATKPAGEDSPFTVAVAADWVAWDLTADYETRGDLAFQGVLAGFYEDGQNRAGAYVAYRNQQNRLGDTLDAFIGDAFVSLEFPEPSGGRILTAFEVAYVRGSTTITRTVLHPEQEVEQLMGVAQVGRLSDTLDVVLEGGYASGDSNAEDAFQTRATFDPDHRVGLILFPEVLAMMSARTANLAGSPELFGRPARGVELLATNGGVSGAYYFFPHTKWRPLEWLEARFGAVIGWSSTDMVDLFQQRAYSRSVNHLGGNAGQRDLGVELDGSVLAHGPLAEGVTLSGGIEGGVLFPGNAFANASGDVMDPVGMLRLRLGLGY